MIQKQIVSCKTNIGIKHGFTIHFANPCFSLVRLAAHVSDGCKYRTLHTILRLTIIKRGVKMWIVIKKEGVKLHANNQSFLWNYYCNVSSK
jgi:hypothetical protein